MTNSIFCVKIGIMKIQMRKKFSYYVILFLFMVLAICCAGFYQTTFLTKAQSISVDSTNFLPQTSLENTELVSPIDVYHDQNVTAIADESQKLLVHHNGNWLSPLTDFQAIKQVKKLNNTTLLVSNAGSI